MNAKYTYSTRVTLVIASARVTRHTAAIACTSGSGSGSLYKMENLFS